MKVALIKYIDKIFGSTLVRVLSRRRSYSDCKPCSFLIIRPGGIGDAVLLMPALLALRRKYQDAFIAVMAEKRNAAVFGLCNVVDEIFLYDSPKQLIKSLREKCDVVIDTEQWYRLSAVVARLAGATVSIGFDTNERKKLFSHPVSYSVDHHETDNFINLLSPLGIESNIMETPFLTIPAEAGERAVSLLGDLANRPFIAVFPGASIPEKRWAVKNFMNLASEINKGGYPIVVIGGENERAAGKAIIDGPDSLNLAGKTSLVETAAIIDMSTLLVSGDSGVLHIAAGLGKPTVSLFGPSNAKKWAPKGERHIVVNNKLPCSPCSKYGNTPKCRAKVGCMSEITADEVYLAVKRLMNWKI